MSGSGVGRDEQLTRNFWMREWAVSSKWPHLATIPRSRVIRYRIAQTARHLQVLRDRVGVPVRITSGWRSPALNAVIPGASDTSDHLTGWGVDVIADGYTNTQLIRIVWELVQAGDLPEPDQVITYENGNRHVHLSWSNLHGGHPRGEWLIKNAGPGYRAWVA